MRIVLSFGSSERIYETERAEVVIGRRREGVDVDVDLEPDRAASRPHARLWLENDTGWIEDLGSKHGTVVRGEVIRGGERRAVAFAEPVRVGETTLRLERTAEGAPLPAADTEDELRPVTIAHVVDAGRRVYSAAEDAPPADARLALFYELPLALAAAPGLDTLLQSVVERLLQVIPAASRGALLLLDQEGKLRLHAHIPRGEPAVSMRLAQRALEGRQAFVWEYSEGDLSRSIRAHNIGSGLYAPLLWQNEPLGVVCADNPSRTALFSRDDVRVMAAVAHHVGMIVKNHQLQERTRQDGQILERLLTSFSPKIRERLLEKARAGRLRLGGEQSEVTILCSDVRGFTALTAAMPAEDVADMLNNYFYALGEEIFRQDGTIDKFVGDSILAVFGSPEPDPRQHEHAVLAAVAMQRAMAEVTASRRQRRRKTCHIGIGVHCGTVLHGFIGSPDRMEYTVIGDAVNRASRLCDAAAPGEILISEPVYQSVFRLIRAEAREIRTKHAEEGPLPAWVVRGIRGRPAAA